MTKRLISLLLLLLTALTVCAQFIVPDSLKLLLNGTGELKLNSETIKSIDFGRLVDKPVGVDEKAWMFPDETLPSIFPELSLKKVVLTLYPYNTQTRFDWDPINKKKIKVGPDTWRGDPYYHLYKFTHYSNWTKKPMDGGVRKSVEEIEATGLRYQPLAERANNMPVGVWKPTPKPTGMDLMAPFTKKFWDFKGRKRRARAKEVMETYGDSTSVNFPYELPKKNKRKK